jgi:uncharacterized protein (DUF1800 family)
LLAGQPLLAEAAVSRTGTVQRPAEIQGQERILHALNRFTFGPRPGDVAAVQAMGLNRWFEMQLNPSSIDDSALDARLAAYPAMNLSIAELEAKYPGPQMIRQMMNGKTPLPGDPTERQMALDQISLYKLQKAKQEAKAAEAAPANSAQTAENAPDADAMDDAPAYSRDAALKILALPPDQRVQAILAMQPQELAGFRRSLRGPERAQLVAGLSPAQKETLLALGGSLKMVGLEETESRVDRDLYSNRQLEAVMTDFWLNHFNVYIRKNQQAAYLIPTYERETIRAHALGSFEDLLVATAMSPAMLEYLDNFRSIGPDSQQAERVKLRPNPNKQAADGLNENYGRELMELHTLGVNGGYTQADVTNVAKVFTGWTIDKPNQPGGGTFVFNERTHEPGSKMVLGQKIKEDGFKEGIEVLHMLANSPATAHFVCQKLAVRFVSDNPPPALVDRMAASFLASHGDIKTVLRTLWNSPEFWSPQADRAKVKTPEEFVFSAVRASGAEVTNPAALVQALNKLGMPLYGMQTPQGYSWKQDDWVNTGALVSRMNFALVLSANRIPGTRIAWDGDAGAANPSVLPASYSGDALEAKEKRLEQELIGEPISERTRAAVLAQANDASVTDQAETQFDLKSGAKQGIYGAREMGLDKPQGQPADPQAAVIAGLLLGSPEFQRR